MTPLATFLELSKHTFGGIPAVIVVNLLQLATFGWVLRELARARFEQQRFRDDAVLKIRAAARAEIWRNKVRPMVITLMLLGPGLGLAMSTLVGALGMGSLGDAMASQIDQQALLAEIGSAYREISYAYLLMVGGTAPMLLGPVLILIARRFEHDATIALGGDREDRMLCAVERIVELLERGAAPELAPRASGASLAHATLGRPHTPNHTPNHTSRDPRAVPPHKSSREPSGDPRREPPRETSREPPRRASREPPPVPPRDTSPDPLLETALERPEASR